MLCIYKMVCIWKLRKVQFHSSSVNKTEIFLAHSMNCAATTESLSILQQPKSENISTSSSIRGCIFLTVSPKFSNLKLYSTLCRHQHFGSNIEVVLHTSLNRMLMQHKAYSKILNTALHYSTASIIFFSLFRYRTM